MEKGFTLPASPPNPTRPLLCVIIRADPNQVMLERSPEIELGIKFHDAPKKP